MKRGGRPHLANLQFQLAINNSQSAISRRGLALRAGGGLRWTPLSAPETAWAPRPRRAARVVARLALAVAAPLLLLGLAEAGLRLAGFGHSTTYFVPQPGHPGRLIDNPHFGRRFFPPGLLRVPPPMSIAREKAPGVYRILVFGESAAMGDPKPAYGVARYLEVLLRERYPGTGFEVIPVAMTAINSHALVPMARECVSLGADAWIVFAGNNEMLGPFGAGSTLGGGSAPWPLVRLVLAAKASRLGQAIQSIADSARPRPAGSSRWSGLRVLAEDHVTGNAPQRARVHASFERNLRDLVHAGRAGGAQVLLSTVAVNLRDCAPFGSVHQPPLDPGRLAEWTRHVETGHRALTNGEAAAALQSLSQAAGLGPRHAALQFLLGETHLASTNLATATEAFTLARDLDTLPLRTDSRLNDILRRVATDLQVPVVDTVTALATASARGVPGGDFFYEHVHLTPEGNHALARAFAEALGSSLPAGVGAQAQGDWAPPETCATRLALTPWNRAAAAELMLRRCFDAPFTQQLNHDAHLLALAGEVARQRRAQTPESARFVRALYTNALAGAAAPDPHLHRNYAEFLEATGDLGEAITQWQRVIELLPHHPVGYFQAGSFLRRTGKLDEARPLIERAVALQPDWIEARLELADLFLARGRPNEAIEACRAALAQQPDHARAHLRLADALAADKQRDAAVKSLEEAVRLDPQLWEARYLLGVEYAVQEKIDAAREQFEAVVRLKPDHAPGRFNLGIAQARRREWEAAAANLAEAVRLDPRNDAAKQALAQVVLIRRQQNPTAPPE